MRSSQTKSKHQSHHSVPMMSGLEFPSQENSLEPEHQVLSVPSHDTDLQMPTVEFSVLNNQEQCFSTSPVPLEQTLMARACDQCYRWKVKCSKEGSGCSRCIASKNTCTYSAECDGRSRKRKPQGIHSVAKRVCRQRSEPAANLGMFSMISALDTCFGF
jgi:hypothetical protein